MPSAFHSDVQVTTRKFYTNQFISPPITFPSVLLTTAKQYPTGFEFCTKIFIFIFSFLAELYSQITAIGILCLVRQKMLNWQKYDENVLLHYEKYIISWTVMEIMKWRLKFLLVPVCTNSSHACGKYQLLVIMLSCKIYKPHHLAHQKKVMLGPDHNTVEFSLFSFTYLIRQPDDRFWHRKLTSTFCCKAHRRMDSLF